MTEKFTVKFIPDDEDVATKKLFKTTAKNFDKDFREFANKVRNEPDFANEVFEHSSGYIVAYTPVYRIGTITQFDQSILYSFTEIH